MNKEKFIKALKIILIIGLLLAISVLAVLQWKSELILDKVMSSIQDELVDSLRYSDAGMDWFGHFPSIAVRITDLKLGSGKTPLIDGGDVDVVIRIWPLLSSKVIINRLHIVNASIHIIEVDGRWSYDLFRKSERTSSSDTLKTKVDQLVIENSKLHYQDGQSLAFTLEIPSAAFRGDFENEKLGLEIQMTGRLSELKMADYTQAEPFEFELDGGYENDLKTGFQDFKNWKINHEGVILTANGTIHHKPDHEEVDVAISWEKGNLALLKKWLPQKMAREWNAYTITGDSEGQATIKGNSSKNETPRITCTTSLKNVNIDFQKENIKGLRFNLAYDSGSPQDKVKSKLEIEFSKSAALGQALEGKIKVNNLERPSLDVTIRGPLPATLLNLLSIPSLRFEQGRFDIHDFVLQNFQPAISNFSTFMDLGSASFSAEDLKFTYLGNALGLTRGEITIGKNQLDLDLAQLTWNKATVSGLKGSLEAKDNQLDYILQGDLCDGNIETKGTLSGLKSQPSCTSTWRIKSIDMKALLASFSDFDQSFITSDHLSGKADIWAETIIPFDEKWHIISNRILVNSAIDIRDGRLQNLKTLEDFGSYVHLEELRDIRFNQLRNYMKIENGRVHLPVMFIQSSAINLSIAGQHGLDQQILYYVKVNAGQTAANKLKKLDFKKDLIRARKSGWINMYFVLEGTTTNVRYQQYRGAVIAGFEQSSALKENLRNHLVEKFGYDVYWLEPNEWEDIPEYE
jgi:AsmA-like C-terminal region